ncbi:MAG: 3-deoxy-7-phosphoheptulonate synthase [Lentisphaeraceae bacterium]|nr:3-deoxy-7-phosphoheptulonate synthase [Lentisphaeraceae bacterium]
MNELENVNIAQVTELPAPEIIKNELPMSDSAKNTVAEGRRVVSDILAGRDSRLMVITGPCSIHSYEVAMDYARRLSQLQQEVPNFYFVMRVYFEKPRTTVGWKGLINDPHLNGTYDIQEGLKQGRKILREIADMGIPTATEFLDPIVPQYIGDLVTWAAIGARTTESQTHREMSSGLSMPVGFKNSTDGSIDVALNAIESSRNPQNFLGITQQGKACVLSTKGNPLGHLVLRGGGGKPNYDEESVRTAVVNMKKRDINPALVVDCSHANSNKDHERQPIVLEDVIRQRKEGQDAIRGVMLESNIGPGNQKITENLEDLVYGVSVTDKCLDWAATDKVVKEAHSKVS